MELIDLMANAKDISEEESKKILNRKKELYREQN